MIYIFGLNKIELILFNQDDKINNNYDQLISNTAKEIEEFVERVNLKN